MAANDSPEWLTTVRREAAIRSGLILYGNVRDIFYDADQRQYVSMPELLVRVLKKDAALGLGPTGIWNQVDGLRFPVSRDLARFTELHQQASTSAQPPPHSGDAYDVGDAGGRTVPDGSRLLTNPGELLPAIRSLQSRGRERCAFLFEWSHLLVGQPAHPEDEHRNWILHLGKALIGGDVVPMDSDHLRRPGGLVIILAANLGLIPPVLYQGDPRIRLIAIPAPGRHERRSFFQRHADDLRCERPRPAPGLPATADTIGPSESLTDSLADMTDQLTLADLRQILSLSLQVDSPLPVDRLLNLYRFGDQRSPWEELNPEKLEQVEPILKRRVVGQDDAVTHASTMMIRAFMGLAGLQHSARRGKPKGTLFFVGPTGTGKTELAKATAEFLFGDESSCIRFDMSEYGQEQSDQRLIGAPPGYVGFEDGGQLTNAVRQRPFSVLLFDEIEKAHPRILDKFLQILEDGRLTDGRGETAYFSESVIIFTSNIGAASQPDSEDPEVTRVHYLRAVEHHFQRELKRPELLNRLGDNIVVFQPIKNQELRRTIILKQVGPLRSVVQERFGVGIDVSAELLDHCLNDARMDQNGRGLGNIVERRVLNPLSRFMFERRNQLRRGRRINLAVSDGHVTFELSE